MPSTVAICNVCPRPWGAPRSSARPASHLQAVSYFNWLNLLTTARQQSLGLHTELSGRCTSLAFAEGLHTPQQTGGRPVEAQLGQCMRSHSCCKPCTMGYTCCQAHLSGRNYTCCHAHLSGRNYTCCHAHLSGRNQGKPTRRTCSYRFSTAAAACALGTLPTSSLCFRTNCSAQGRSQPFSSCESTFQSQHGLYLDHLLSDRHASGR